MTWDHLVVVFSHDALLGCWLGIYWWIWHHLVAKLKFSNLNFGFLMVVGRHAWARWMGHEPWSPICICRWKKGKKKTRLQLFK